jgi:hypothetical protein
MAIAAASNLLQQLYRFVVTSKSSNGCHKMQVTWNSIGGRDEADCSRIFGQEMAA